MNPIPEEVGQTTRAFMEKVPPATLAMIVCNIALLGFIFYALHGAAEFRQQMLELLAKCSGT